MILSFESSTKNCSVACIGEGGVVIAHIQEATDQYVHAEKMHLFAEQILKENNIKTSDLQAIAIGTGPGSYTGLRIGTALAKGMAYTLNIPLIACSSLRSIVQPYFNHPDYSQNAIFIAVIDARRMEVYHQIFDYQGRELSPIEAKVVDSESYSAYLQQGQVYIIGDEASKLAAVLPSEFSIINSLPNAANMAVEAWGKLKTQKFEDLAYYEPHYLKEFLVGKSKK